MPPINGKDLRIGPDLLAQARLIRPDSALASATADPLLGGLDRTSEFGQKFDEMKRLATGVLDSDSASKSAENGKVKNAPEVENAATQFEALLLHQMFKEMWNSVPKNGMLSGSREEELYRDMLNESLADSIAKQQGIGIRDVIAKDIKEIQQQKKKQ